MAYNNGYTSLEGCILKSNTIKCETIHHPFVSEICTIVHVMEDYIWLLSKFLQTS